MTEEKSSSPWVPKKKITAQSIRVAGLSSHKRSRRNKSKLERVLDRLHGALPPRSVCICLQQMGFMLQNGMGISRVIDSIVEQQDHPQLIDALENMHDQVVFRGEKLSQAMSAHPNIFPNYAVIFTKVGETGGDLAGRLQRAADLMERNGNLVMQMKSAVMTPLMTMAFSFLVVIGICKTIMPKFVEMYRGMGIELPFITQVVMLGVAIINHWATWVGALALLGSFVYYRKPMRLKLSEWVLRFPKLKYWYGTMLCTEFCDILGSLLAEGISLNRALQVMASCTAIPYHKEHLEKASNRLREDGDIMTSLRQIHYFPPTFLQVLAVGEEMGGLDTMLGHLRELFEQQTQAVTDTIVKMLEPITMAITGTIMCFIFIGLFLPVYSILKSL